jgi:O-acetyl-ADP-ribose deacetylase (regulator of RNase III)
MMMLPSRIQLVQGDITTLDVDAIVTAANESLLGGGGVDGAIHRAAGPGLLEECRTIGICPEGEARITRGYLLPARHVIHTVGPVWDGGGYNEAQSLKSCYESTLQLALKHNIKSIAFPCIATGVYMFPKDQACEIAVTTVLRWLATSAIPETVVFCCYEDEDFALYNSRLSTTSHAG